VSVLDLSDAPTDDRIRYFKTDVSSNEDVERAVEGTVAWTRETGAQLGGVLCAAGVAVANKVSTDSTAYCGY